MKKPKGEGKPEDFFLRLLTRSLAKPFVMSSPHDDRLRVVIQTLADNILDFIRSNLKDPDMAHLFQPGRVVVTTIPQATVQALTVWMDPVHSIAVNHGLMLFMYRLARAIAPHVITRGPNDPPAPPESEAVSIIATMLDWMSSPVRAPLVADWQTGEREIRTAENIATAGERFVVSHEIAHIMRQHLIVDARKADASKMTLRDLAKRPYEQEIEADVIGASLSMESMIPQNLAPQAGAVGIAMFLQSLRLAEEVGAIVTDEKHPAAGFRLDVLWQTLPQRYGADFSRLTQAANEIGSLVARLGDQALQERNTRRKKAVEYMERIFREHPATQGLQRNIRADKAMLDETLELLRTAPSAVLEAISANLLDADEYRAVASAAGSPAELFKNDRARRHGIAHFLARYLPDNVRPVLGVEWVSLKGPRPKQ